jgi:predicted RNase H-like HicB family nuclease
MVSRSDAKENSMPVAHALIHEEGQVFGVSFPDFPGVVATARSVEEVIRKGSEALTFHVAGMVEDGDTLPMSRSLAELKSDRAYRVAAKGAVVAVIPFELPAKAVRLNISMDETLLQAVDRAAEAVGQTRSAFLAEAARQRLRAS